MKTIRHDMAGILAKVLLGYFICIQATQQFYGVTGEDGMFEVVAPDRKNYLLSDCQKHFKDGFNCRCLDLGRKCNTTDTERCGNCRCLTEDLRTFYISKRYGGICVSVNQLKYAAGFGDAFVIFNEPGGVCATIQGTSDQYKYIYHTKSCNTSDTRQLWFWTPGKLLMNAYTFKCLDAQGTGRYRPMLINRCDSTAKAQKYKCNDKYWFGIAARVGSQAITHATRYWSARATLLARIIAFIDSGSYWTTYPTNNSSVCEPATSQATFFFADNNENNSYPIDYLGCSVSGSECTRRLHTKSNAHDLSSCKLFFEQSDDNQSTPHFSLESRKDGVYFKWMPESYSSLAGMIFNLNIKCLSDNIKFKDFFLSFRFKDIQYQTLQGCYQFIGNTTNTANISTLGLGKGCNNSVCSKQLNAPSTLNRNKSVCKILWDKSTTLTNTSAWLSINESLRLFSLKKDDNSSLHLKWKSSNSSLLKEIVFNLTIFCYDEQNKNFSLAETSCLVFQTEYKTGKKYEKTLTGKDVPLEIILPIVFLVIISLIIVIVYCYYQRRRRIMKTQESQVNLHQNLKNAYSNQSEDNPCYEDSNATKHPTVTIARNQLYEHTDLNQESRPVSDIYEKPMQSVQASMKAFQSGKPPKTKEHGYKTPKPNPAKPYTKKNTNQQNDTPQPNTNTSDECYDQPLAFIPNGNQSNSELAPPSDKYDNRLSSPYIRTLPREPDNVYDYATREEISSLPSSYLNDGLTENQPEMASENDNVYSNVNHNEMRDAPFYDVLDYTHGKN